MSGTSVKTGWPFRTIRSVTRVTARHPAIRYLRSSPKRTMAKSLPFPRMEGRLPPLTHSVKYFQQKASLKGVPDEEELILVGELGSLDMGLEIFNGITQNNPSKTR